MDKTTEKTGVTIKKPKKKRCLRIKRASESDDHQSEEELDENLLTILEDAKDIRKLRQRPNGVSAVGLALGKKLTTEEELIADDPFKLKTGGFVDMKALKGRGRSGIEELDAVNLGNTFSAETNRRDEDADMMKYIEEELSKRKGILQTAQKPEEASPRKAEDVLFEMPEHLRQSSSKRSEEMLSNQMLSGIPEVDLGIDERIRNIEATEEAKQQLLKERMTKKEKSMSFVPTNMAVNFVQHNRFNVEESDQPKAKKLKESKPELKVMQETSPLSESVMPSRGLKPNKPKMDDEEKATDDFHFEKFKKQFRRY